MNNLRSSNVHYHGIVHAIIFTFWVYFTKINNPFFLEATQNLDPSIFFLAYDFIIYTSYLFFTIWQYTLASKKNTILTNFHSGVVLSFIHPFIYAFFVQIFEYQHFSLDGLSTSYMVSLMLASFPIAIFVYFIRKNKIDDIKHKKENILDDFL